MKTPHPSAFGCHLLPLEKATVAYALIAPIMFTCNHRFCGPSRTSVPTVLGEVCLLTFEGTGDLKKTAGVNPRPTVLGDVCEIPIEGTGDIKPLPRFIGGVGQSSLLSFLSGRSKPLPYHFG